MGTSHLYTLLKGWILFVKRWNENLNNTFHFVLISLTILYCLQQFQIENILAHDGQRTTHPSLPVRSELQHSSWYVDRSIIEVLVLFLGERNNTRSPFKDLFVEQKFQFYFCKPRCMAIFIFYKRATSWWRNFW